MSELWGAVLQQPLGFSLPSMIVAAPRDKNNGRHRSGMVELVEIVCSIATSVNPTPKIRVMLHHQPEGKPNLIEMQPTFSSLSTDARDGHSSAKISVRDERMNKRLVGLQFANRLEAQDLILESCRWMRLEGRRRPCTKKAASYFEC